MANPSIPSEIIAAVKKDGNTDCAVTRTVMWLESAFFHDIHKKA